MMTLHKIALVAAYRHLTYWMNGSDSAVPFVADSLQLLSDRFNSESSIPRRKFGLGDLEELLPNLQVKVDLRAGSRRKRGAQVAEKAQELWYLAIWVYSQWILERVLSLSRPFLSRCPSVQVNAVVELRRTKLNTQCLKAIASPIRDQTKPRTPGGFGTVLPGRVQQEDSSGKVIESLSGICGMCKEDVRTKKFSSERRYGLLESCEHAFCYGCVRKACGVSDLDVVSGHVICPTCFTRSEVVAASYRWLKGRDKVKFFEAFRDGFSCRMKPMFKKYRTDPAEYAKRMLVKDQNDLTYDTKWKFTKDQPDLVVGKMLMANKDGNDLSDDMKWKFTKTQPDPADDMKWKFTKTQPDPADDTEWKFTNNQPPLVDDTEWKFTENQLEFADDMEWKFTESQPDLADDTEWKFTENQPDLADNMGWKFAKDQPNLPVITMLMANLDGNFLPFGREWMAIEDRKNPANWKPLITRWNDSVWDTNSRECRHPGPSCDKSLFGKVKCTGSFPTLGSKTLKRLDAPSYLNLNNLVY